MLKIAEARSSEYHSTWGNPGNQEFMEDLSDGELRIRDLSYDFQYLFRWIDKDKATKASLLAIGIVKNPNVGYSQNNGAAPRTTCYDALESNGWQPDLITVPVNTDCSAMIAAVVSGAGVPVSKDMYTGNEAAILGNTGAFEIIYIEGKKHEYVTGDILLRNGHTAIVVDTDAPEQQTMIVSNCKAVNMRNYVGTADATPLQVLNAGEKVVLTGKTSTWYECTCNGKTGWVSGKYLE